MDMMHFQEGARQEIAELERRLQKKKEAVGMTDMKNDKEVFKEVFRERFNELADSVRAAGDAQSSPVANTKRDDDVKGVKKEEEMKALLYMAFEKHPKDAIQTALSLEGGEYLLDELHDRLADQYYDKLLEFQKIKRM